MHCEVQSVTERSVRGRVCFLHSQYSYSPLAARDRFLEFAANRDFADMGLKALWEKWSIVPRLEKQAFFLLKLLIISVMVLVFM
jgi:hypothetical protein